MNVKILNFFRIIKLAKAPFWLTIILSICIIVVTVIITTKELKKETRGKI